MSEWEVVLKRICPECQGVQSSPQERDMGFTCLACHGWGWQERWVPARVVGIEVADEERHKDASAD